MDADLLRKGSAMKIARVIAASLCEDEKNEAQMRLRQEKCSSREAPGSAETCTDEKRKAAQWETLICVQSSFRGRIGNVDLCD